MHSRLGGLTWPIAARDLRVAGSHRGETRDPSVCDPSRSRCHAGDVTRNRVGLMIYDRGRSSRGSLGSPVAGVSRSLGPSRYQRSRVVPSGTRYPSLAAVPRSRVVVGAVRPVTFWYSPARKLRLMNA